MNSCQRTGCTGRNASVLIALVFLLVQRSWCQLGIYGTYGSQKLWQQSSGSFATPTVGAFYDRAFSRVGAAGRWTIGADVRSLGGSLGVVGFGVGPRASLRFERNGSLVSPYAEFLLGRGHTADGKYSLLLAESSVGLDLGWRHFGFRVIDFDYGVLAGSAGGPMRTISTGFFARF